jgi:O-antigen/teichoic acid export membrane protein
MVGANITRKTWLAAVFTAVAAVVNFVLNLFLIPLYGAIGAAISTLVAYFVMALLAYLVNQRIYPVPFEVGRFIGAALIGSAVYLGSYVVMYSTGAIWKGPTWPICIVGSIAYGALLIFFGRSGKP